MKNAIYKPGRVMLLTLAALLSLAGLLFTANRAAAACTYSILPTSLSVSFGPSNSTVTVTTTAGCVWGVTNTTNWIQINSATNNTNSGTVSLTVLTNSTSFARTGTVKIASQTLTVTQAAGPCGYSLSTTSRTHGHSATNGTNILTTSSNCPWSVSNPNTWIKILSSTSGTGSSNIIYSVTNNPSLDSRTGLVTIANQTFTIVQLGIPCVFSLSPPSKTNGNGGTSVSVIMSASSNLCHWAISTSNSWIHITSAANGFGSNLVTFSIDTNPSSLDRTGFVMMADQVFTEVQRGAACNYSISPSTSNRGYTGTASAVVNVNVAMDCPWNIVNNNNWITFTNLSGAGSNQVYYSVGQNPSGLPRTGQVVIASQLFTVSQNGAPCLFTFTPTNGTHTATMETGQVTVATLQGCPWIASSTNTWIHLASGATNTGTGTSTVSYVVATNDSYLARTGSISFNTNLFVVSQQGNGCAYKLSATTRTHGYTGTSSATLGLATSNSCPWTAVTTNSWISFISGTNGPGSNTITYAVAPNPTPYDRVGVIMVADQVLTITQPGFPCDYSLSTTNRPHGNKASGGTIIVNTSSNLCPWTVVNSNSWIAIITPTNGVTVVGSNIFTYTIEANLDISSRTGRVYVADQILTINQQGVGCSFSLSSDMRTNGFGATVGTVALTASSNLCAWTVSTSNDWIHVVSGTNGIGDTNVTFLIDANPSSLQRIGYVNIGDQVFTEVQRGAPCTYSISPTNSNRGFNGTTNSSIAVNVAGDCPWTVSNPPSWITILAPLSLSGSGTGVVSYAMDPNPSILPRTGTVSIAGQTLTLSQNGAPCSLTLTPDSQTYQPAAVTGVVAVAAPLGCSWITTPSNNWIMILSGQNGSGNGSVTYSLLSNNAAHARSGSLTIGDQVFPINQLGTNCDYFLSATTRSHGYTGTTNATVGITTDTNCVWSVSISDAWITLKSAVSGTGTGIVSYAVDPNPGFTDRIGTIAVSGATLILTQRSFACNFALSPPSHSHGHDASGGSILLNCASNACPWSITNLNSWVHLTSPPSGQGPITVTYTVDANTSLDARTGLVMIADQVLTLTQDGFPCNPKLTPSNRTHGFAVTNNTVSLTNSSSLCTWTVVNTNDWITFTNTSGIGDVTLNYSVSANFGTNARAGVVLIADQPFTLTQKAISNLTFTGMSFISSNQVKLTLAGGPDGVWEIQGCPDLVHWTKIGTVTNTTGRVGITDTLTNGVTKRFYRAVQQPAPISGISSLGAAMQAEGHLKLTLTGGPSGVWELQGSTDLKVWSKITDLTNSTGQVDFIDPTVPSNSTRRFYRAVQP